MFKNIWKCFLSVIVAIGLFSTNNLVVNARNSGDDSYIAWNSRNPGNHDYRLIFREFSACVWNWANEEEKSNLRSVLGNALSHEELWYCLDFTYNYRGIYSLWLFQQLECLLSVSTEGSTLHSNLSRIYIELREFISRRYFDVLQLYLEQNHNVGDVLHLLLRH